MIESLQKNNKGEEDVWHTIIEVHPEIIIGILPLLSLFSCPLFSDAGIFKKQARNDVKH